MTFVVAVEYDSEEKVHNASVPALPGCVTWGTTEEEALENIKDAIRCYLEMVGKIR